MPTLEAIEEKVNARSKNPTAIDINMYIFMISEISDTFAVVDSLWIIDLHTSLVSAK